MKRKKNLYLTGTYILLTVLAVIWLIPIIWIFLTSFRGEGANAVPYFFPKTYTFNNYIKLFTSDAYPFGKWFINTFIVATCTCILSTLITVGMAYSLSRIKFKHRNGFLKLALVLNMFPGFMSMIAVYYILKALNLTQTLTSLVLVYSAGAALGFYIAKGFFDTIPYSLDESAMIDGASRWQNFRYITLPFLVPTMTVNMVLNLKAGITTFDYAFALTGGGPNRATEFIGLMIYNDGFKDSNFAVANAKAVVLALIIAILSFIQIRQSLKHEIN